MIASLGVTAVQGSEFSWVKELQFSRSELLLLEVGSWRRGIIQEPKVRGKSGVRSRYQATIGEEDAAEWEDSVRVVVNCSVCELAKAL
jgi:hypothetical protein